MRKITEILSNSDANTVHTLLTARKLPFHRSFEELMRQWDPYKHDVFDESKRKKKKIKVPTGQKDPMDGSPIYKNEFVDRVRIALPTQRVVVDRIVGFMLTNPVTYKANSHGVVLKKLDNKQQQLYDAIMHCYHDNKMKYFDKKLVRTVSSQCEAAELWYMTTDENGRLLLSLGGSTGQLDDYAVYALALLSLYRASFDAEYLKAAIRRAEQITELFEDEKGGYFMYAHDAEALISRPKELYDGAIPSGNSVAAMVFEELAALTGETKWRERSDRQLGFIAGRTERYPAGSSFALLAMAKRLMPGRELVCVSECVPTELTEYLKANAAYELSVLYKSTQNSPLLAECAPFTEAYPVPEKGACWYLCENGACHAPQSEFPL